MTERKTIAVVGATAAQGGRPVRAIAKDPAGEFRARALTRNAGSDAAKALATLPNVDVVIWSTTPTSTAASAFPART